MEMDKPTLRLLIDRLLERRPDYLTLNTYDFLTELYAHFEPNRLLTGKEYENWAIALVDDVLTQKYQEEFDEDANGKY